MVLDYPRKSGVSRRDSQEQARKTYGRKPKGWIDEPEVPACGEHIWSAFWELDSARRGLESITYSEISAYAACVGVSLCSMDVRAIKAMDNARIKASADIEKEK